MRGADEGSVMQHRIVGGDRDLQQTAAVALAIEGGEQAEAALAEVIAEGLVAEDAIPDVVHQLVHPK